LQPETEYHSLGVRSRPIVDEKIKLIAKRITTSKSFIDVSELPVATNFPSGLNLAHLAIF
jgi:hypothetical protein